MLPWNTPLPAGLKGHILEQQHHVRQSLIIPPRVAKLFIRIPDSTDPLYSPRRESNRLCGEAEIPNQCNCLQYLCASNLHCYIERPTCDEGRYAVSRDQNLHETDSIPM